MSGIKVKLNTKGLDKLIKDLNSGQFVQKHIEKNGIKINCPSCNREIVLHQSGPCPYCSAHINLTFK